MDEVIAERFPEWDEQIKRKDSVLKKLPNDIKRDWNNSSLLTVDNFLKTNSKSILCADLSFLYYKFWFDLKRIKSNSMNFMGYSEFLITRLMLHLLEAKYCPYKNGVTYSTVNRASPSSDLGNFRVGRKVVMATECIPEELRKEMGKLCKRKPDIVIYNSRQKELLAVIQVKAFPSSASSVENDLDLLDKINAIPAFSSAKGLVVIFSKFNKSEKSDDRVYSLWDKQVPFSKIVRDKLKVI